MKKITLGKITGVHGVKGEIKIMPYTEKPESIVDYQPWQLQGVGLSVQVASFRRQGEGLVVKLKGLDDRDEAKTLVGSFIVVEREQLPALERGYYWTDLLGLRVTNLEGLDLGVVDYLFETGSNDVLVVKQGNQETLIPYRLDEVIVEVDLEKGTMKVDWEP